MSVSKRFVRIATGVLFALALLAAGTSKIEARSAGHKAPAKQPVVVSIFDDAAMQRVQATGALPDRAADGTPYVERFFNRVGDQTYVVQRGWDANGNCRAWAISAEEIAVPAPVKDTCTGNPCSSCSFTYAKDGTTITGCKCNDNPPHADHICNHSISTGTVSDPIDGSPVVRQN
jgi:hypothetical protein